MGAFSDFLLPFDEIGTVLKVWGQQSNAVVTKAFKAAVKAGDRMAVEATPVDTGAARSNWVVTIDDTFYGQIPPYAPYPKNSHTGRGETANAGAAVAQGDSAIAPFDSTVNIEAHIQNNLDYIELLDSGDASKQGDSMLALGLKAAEEAAIASFVEAG